MSSSTPTTASTNGVSTPDLIDHKSTAAPSGVLKINGSTIAEHTKNGFGEIVEIMKATNAFPSGPTRTLYSAYPAFNNIVSETSNQILGTIAKILKHQQIKGNIQRRDNDEQLELVLEANDFMLERINSNLDELAGIRKLPETVLVQSELHTPANASTAAISSSWNTERASAAAIAAKRRTTKLLTARNIVRPQIAFKTPIDNSNSTPFIPQLTDKPNSLKPLAILPEYDDNGDIISYLHPYEFELDKLDTPAALLTPVQPQPARPLRDTPLHHVATEAQLGRLLADLRGAEAFAIDLEHHSYRTFQGITCLMQISTRDADYIVDTLALRDELRQLNAVFTDARKLKVLHGADSDVEWLQRDLALYLVNVFDTHQAAKRLNLARLSLQFLLKHYCDLEVDKTFQLADWRIRPLPEELQLYARQDTHYLLYVYEVMRNALLAEANGQTNLLRAVHSASTEICKRRYVKARCTADSHLDMYARSKRAFDNRQLHALQAIYAWRDKIARQEDESCGYVLPNHMMLHMAEVLPREMQGILACCNPIPPLVRQHLHALHGMVLKAREQPLVRPVAKREEEEDQQLLLGGKMRAVDRDLMGPLYCPHDLTQAGEFRDDLPTLLGGQANGGAMAVAAVAAQRSACSVFDTPDVSPGGSDAETPAAELDGRLQRIRQLHLVSPYARYLTVLPLAEKQRLAEQAERDAENRKRKLCPDAVVQTESAAGAAAIVAAAERAPAEEKLSLRDVGKRQRVQKAETEQMAAAAAAQLQHDDGPARKRARFEIDVTPKKTQGAGNDSAEASTSATPGSANSAQQQQQRSGKKSKPMSNKKSAQSSSKPVAFNYAQVDFSQFKGGSRAQEVNTHGHTSKHQGRGNKGRRGQDKQFNKLLTFNKSGGGVAKRK